MQLNREKIQRMFTGSQAYGGGGGGGDTEGLASQLWVDQNYLSKEFFLRLFNIHGEDENDDPVDVQPNDLETTITDIEAMFGFWTEQYLSALGQNSEQGGGGITLNAALSSINNSPLGNPTGTSTVLMFNGTTWVYASMGSTDMNTVWNALADGTDTHQINVSHLTTALGSYFTQGSGISITNTVGGTGKTISLAQVQDLTAGTYKSVTVDTYGRVTAGTNPTTLAGYGITDALASNTTFWGRTIASGAVKGGIDQASYIEFADIASGTTNGGYIDFHYGGNTTANSGDYTSRIIEDAFDATNSQGTLKINNILWAKLSTGVSIGTSTISSDYKLNVAGYTKTSRLYLAEGVYLEYDSTNSGVHLVGAGFYSDSYVSALGVNSGGGGGGGGSDYIPLVGSDQIAGSLIPVTTNAYDLGDSTHAWRNIRGSSIYASNSITTYYLTANSTVTAVGSITSTAGNIIASAGYVSAAAGFKVSSLDSLTANDYVLLGGGRTSKLKTINGYSIFGEGNIDASGGGTGNYLPLTGGTITGNTEVYIGIKSTSNSETYYIGADGDSGYLWGSGGSGYYLKLKSGKVGIGNISPAEKFEVDGYVKSSGFKVGTSTGFLKADGTVDSTNYLPLTGGTLNNGTTDTPLSLKGIGNGVYINFINTEYSIDGYIGISRFLGLVYYNNNHSYKIWNEDNDGTNSGLDADLLDGNHASYFAPASSLNNYLPITGGTLSGTNDTPLYIKSSNNNSAYIKFVASDNTLFGYIGVDSNSPVFYKGTTYKIWNESNDGSGSGLDADLLDGQHGSYYAVASDLTSANNNISTLQGYFTNASANRARYIETYYNGNWQGDSYKIQAVWDDVSHVRLSTTNGTYDVRVTAADKLVTSRTLWGQSFNGTENITGSLSSVSGLFADTNDTNDIGSSTKQFRWIYSRGVGSGSGIFYIYTNDVARMTVSSGGDVGIGTISPSYKLDVNGTVGVANTITLTGGTAAKQRIYFDSTHYIELDSSGYFHFSHGVYSDGFMSALGLNSGGGGAAADYIPLSGSTSITGDLTPSNNNSVNLGSSSKLWAGVYCTNLRAYGASSIGGNLTMAGNITPTVNQQYGLGTSSLKFSSLHVLNSYTYGTLTVNHFTLYEDTYSPAQGVTYTQSHLKSTLNVMYLDCSNGIQSSNTISTRSDIRLKTIQRYIDYLSVDAVASAPIFDYTWNEKPNGNVFVGTSAQYWQQVLPNAVSPMFDRFLSLDYSATALVSAVITARKVVDHEARIRLLEARYRLLEVENAALRNEINQLKKVA